ncbi:MAG: hypothetical protein CMJ46_04635 [Planctomyces sp.]|nr:hypothetical protein [Planctomyces sp.]
MFRFKLLISVLITAATVFSMLVASIDVGTGAQQQELNASETPTNEESIAYGKYLVHDVAKCIECHTPRDASGELIDSRQMEGAPIPVEPPAFVDSWAAASASVAGLGNYEPDFVRHVLMHGTRPNGVVPDNPMPQFQMKQREADAIVRYLESLSAR